MRLGPRKVGFAGPVCSHGCIVWKATRFELRTGNKTQVPKNISHLAFQNPSDSRSLSLSEASASTNAVLHKALTLTSQFLYHYGFLGAISSLYSPGNGPEVQRPNLTFDLHRRRSSRRRHKIGFYSSAT